MPEPSIILELIKTAGTVVTAAGLVVAVRQMKLNREISKAHHRRAKSERAILLLMDFAKNMGPRWRAATKLVEHLEPGCLESLYNGVPFTIPADKLALLNGTFPERSSEGNKSKLTLTEKEVFDLRWEIVSYLNMLEFICHAAIKDVADYKIVRTELHGLWHPKQNRTFCRGYRETANGRVTHPMLFDFIAREFERPEHDPEKIEPGAMDAKTVRERRFND